MESNDSQDFQLNLTPDEIVHKSFRFRYRGYDQNEVDPFLDTVIKDYETMIERIKTLEQDNSRLVKRVDELTKQTESLSGSNSGYGIGPAPTNYHSEVTPNAPVNSTNYDILRRISNLERHVFGDKEADRLAHQGSNDNSSFGSYNSRNYGQLDR